MTTNYPGSLDSYSTKVDGVDDVLAAHINNPQDAIEALEAYSQTMSLIKARNTSGATVAANDIGYLDEAGEFKTTTTAYLDAAWCVVISGAANNSDIIVARRGRVTVELNGNCSAGDFLYTSTTTGRAQPQSYMRPEVFAVAITANAGGAGGTCTALLMTGTTFVLVYPAEYIARTVNSDDYDFVSTIATLPGGAVLTYGAIGAGDEITIVPAYVDNLAKLRLFNSTRSTYGLIDNAVAGTNTVTLTANVPGGWQVGDTITAQSQTCVIAGPPYYYDFDFSSADNVIVPELARSIDIEIEVHDTGVAGTGSGWIHTWETYAAAKNRIVRTMEASVWVTRPLSVPLYQQRICYLGTASGAGTLGYGTKINGYWVAVP